jgi:hypothetical protein
MDFLQSLTNIDVDHPLWSWIEGAILSASHCLVAPPMADVMADICTFVNLLLPSQQCLNSLPMPVLFDAPHRIISQLIAVLPHQQDGMCSMQLKWVRYFPVLLDVQLNKNKGAFLHMFQDTPDYMYASLFHKVMQHSSTIPSVIDASLDMTQSIIVSQQIPLDIKPLIMQSCTRLSKSGDSASSIRTYGAVAEDLVVQFGPKFFSTFSKKIGNVTLSEAVRIGSQLCLLTNMKKEAEQILARGDFGSALTKAVFEAENRRNTEARNVDEIIKVFYGKEIKSTTSLSEIVFDGTPMFALGNPEIEQLKIIASSLWNVDNVRNESLPEGGRRYGREFAKNPTIQNLIPLISIVRLGVKKVLDKTPYIMQCLSVCAVLLHHVNGNDKKGLKGRVAQVATGEGKTIIVSMIALCAALMGQFVDVITSTHYYLANRDLKIVHSLYKAFGVSSSSIAMENPPREAFDGVILYGISTDFEFALLRDGVFCYDNVVSTPLGGHYTIPREAHTAIVDESDNLFIDTASNSVRIAYHSDIHYEWVYKPIFDAVSNNIRAANSVMKILQEYEGGSHCAELQTISLMMINQWISSAITAMQKKLNEDYIITQESLDSPPIIEIVSHESTGRVTLVAECT